MSDLLGSYIPRQTSDAQICECARMRLVGIRTKRELSNNTEQSECFHKVARPQQANTPLRSKESGQVKPARVTARSNHRTTRGGALEKLSREKEMTPSRKYTTMELLASKILELNL